MLCNSVLVILLMLSMLIGTMVCRLIIRENADLYWIKRNNVESLVLLLVSVFNFNLLLMVAGVGLFMSGLSNRTSCTLLLLHWILVMFLVISTYNNNLCNVIILVICIDIISIINVMLVKDSIGEGIWYYLLYQSLISMLIYLLICFSAPGSGSGLLYLVGLLYYYKLGSGIGGYYIPNLYLYIMNFHSVLLIYIGITNIILMYNPIYLLSLFSNPSSSSSSQIPGKDTGILSSFSFLLEYNVIMLNLLIVCYLIYIWISNGYLFVNNWLYLISISTVILSNLYNIFVYIDVLSYSVVYHLYSFTFTYILMWFTLVLTLLVYSNLTS